MTSLPPNDEKVTADELRRIGFTRTMRGYDPEEVDALLSRVTSTLEAHVRAEAALRKAAASKERQGAAEPALHDPEGAAQRLLAAAQRTADAMSAEAEEYAAGIRSEADEYYGSTRREADRYAEAVRAEADDHAETVRTEADEYAGTTRSEADRHAESVMAAAADEARRAAEEARATLVAEMGALERNRDVLQSDIARLAEHLEGRRGQVLAAIEDMRRAVESGDLVGDAAVPELSELEEVPRSAPLTGDAESGADPDLESDEPTTAASMLDLQVDDEAGEAEDAPAELGEDPVHVTDRAEDLGLETATEEAHAETDEPAGFDDLFAADAETGEVSAIAEESADPVTPDDVAPENTAGEPDAEIFSIFDAEVEDAPDQATGADLDHSGDAVDLFDDDAVAEDAPPESARSIFDLEADEPEDHAAWLDELGAPDHDSSDNGDEVAAAAASIFDVDADEHDHDEHDADADSGPATQMMAAVDVSGDRFFEELARRDDDGLGPLDEDTDAALAAFFEPDDDDLEDRWRNRFGPRN